MTDEDIPSIKLPEPKPIPQPKPLNTEHMSVVDSFVDITGHRKIERHRTFKTTELDNDVRFTFDMEPAQDIYLAIPVTPSRVQYIACFHVAAVDRGTGQKFNQEMRTLIKDEKNQDPASLTHALELFDIAATNHLKKLQEEQLKAQIINPGGGSIPGLNLEGLRNRQ